MELLLGFGYLPILSGIKRLVGFHAQIVFQRSSHWRTGSPSDTAYPAAQFPNFRGGGLTLLRSALRGADHALERVPFTLNAKSIYLWKQVHAKVDIVGIAPTSSNFPT